MRPDVERLVAAPRPVPASLSARLRFGGPFGLIGWMFLGIGGVLSIIFASFVQPGLWLAINLGETTTVEGRVLGWEETDASVNEQPVVATGFEFEVDGVVYEGASFAVAEGLGAGETVTVEYVVGDPRAARIAGMEIGVMPIWVMLFLPIFPLIGLGFALKRLVGGGREVRLMRHGRVAYGEVVRSEPTGVTVNDVPQYAVTVEFIDHLDRRQQITSKTLTPQAVVDEPDAEPVLYLPERPERGLLLDSKPGVIEIGAGGHWRPSGGAALIASTVPPALAITGMTIAWLALY